jgi:hypothetical protein
MYTARFEFDADQAFDVAIASWAGASPPLPAHLVRAWVEARDVDFALRVTAGGTAGGGSGSGSRAFMVSADARGGGGGGGDDARLRSVIEALRTRTGAAIPADAAAHDALAAAFPPHRLRVAHDAYRAGHASLACGFRLFGFLAAIARRGRPAGGRVAYQANFRRFPSSREEERRVRKAVAALGLDRDLPRAVRATQLGLLRRLLEPGGAFLVDELLGCDDAGSLDAIRRDLGRHFEDTLGRVGFAAPPIDVAGAAADVEHLVVTGRHSSRFTSDADVAPDPVEWASAGVSAGDVVRMLTFADADAPAGAAGTAGGAAVSSSSSPSSPPVVFISYSTPQFAMALETCRFVERGGLACWMAPRDIPPGAAYPDAIAAAIRQCRAMVVLVSEAANVSPHVKREVERALHHKAAILPVRVQDVRPTEGMEYLLSLCQWVDAYRCGLDACLPELMTRLRAVAGGR